MIKLNTPYTIENGDVVTFVEGKKGSITGTYGDGTITGTLDGNLLKSTFHNTKANAVGLMEITFFENSFDAKWKSGLEPGPMRGKWSGTIQAEVGKNEVIDNNGVSLYKFCQGYEENSLLKLESILTELVTKGTFQGKESVYTLIETIQEINRTFGSLCWFADREPFDGIKSLEYYSTKWGDLLEALKEKAVLSSEFRTLGENIQSEYQPFFDGNKAKEFTEEVYAIGIEKAVTYEDITWFTAATINGEYFESDALVLAAGKKAIELVENPDNYVGICFNDESELTYNEEIMLKSLEIIRDMTDEINPKLLGFLREDLENNGYDDLLQDL